MSQTLEAVKPAENRARAPWRTRDTETVAASAPPGYAGAVHPTLALIAATKDKAEQLRSELVAAEREHHEAILAAVNEPDDGSAQARFSIAEIASAAGVSRGRIYKRLGKPSYGDRSTAKPAYR